MATKSTKQPKNSNHNRRNALGLLARFPTGTCHMTPGVDKAIGATAAQDCLLRHVQCDWGNVCDSDKRKNDASVRAGNGFIQSEYVVSGHRIWVVTYTDAAERPRFTNVMLPTEW
jgi:hypothetical protein